jgi:serine protease inhibitor
MEHTSIFCASNKRRRGCEYLGVVVLRKAIAVILVPFFLLTALSGCGGSSSVIQTIDVQAMADVVEKGGTDFDFALFRQIVEESPNENVVLSPLSAKIALTMAYNGATGETKDAMAGVLGLEGLSLEEANRGLQSMMTSLKRADEEVQLEIANSMWAKEIVNFYEDFLERNRSYFDAEIASADLTDPETITRINAWVKEKTEGKIDEMVDKIDPLVILVILNAIYFKGTWADKFDVSLTRESPFQLLDGDTVQVPMMYQSKVEHEYFLDANVQAVSLPYGDGRLSMYVFLPAYGKDYRDLLAGFTSENWERWMDSFYSEEINISLPRFKIEYEKNLDDALEALGMGPAYIGGFGDMEPGGEGDFIGKVLQKTFIEVNEEGTEAAAATEMEMTMGIGEVMMVNQPFVFAIRDNQTGAILFLGSITNPEAGV